MFTTARKTLIAVVGPVVGWAQLVVASPSAPVTANEWLVLLIGEATALGVYSVANKS